VENPIFFFLAAAAAGLTVYVLVLFCFPRDYDEIPKLNPARMLHLADVLLSGGLSGFIYWLVAYWPAPFSKKNVPENPNLLGRD
jgi:hypothetical protein